MPPSRPRGLIAAIASVMCLVLAGGCQSPPAGREGGSAESRPATASPGGGGAQGVGDLAGLARLCNVPASVTAARWQTYQQGPDWGLVALLEVAPGREPSPESLLGPALSSDTVMVAPAGVPAWARESGVEFTPTAARGLYRVNRPVHEPSAFIRSPLLHGFVVQVNSGTLLLGLHTR